MLRYIIVAHAICLVASASLAGGTFGSSDYISDKAGKIAGGLKVIPSQTIEEALKLPSKNNPVTSDDSDVGIPVIVEPEPASPFTPAPSEPAEIVTYEILWQNKSAGEKAAEKKLSEELNFGVSTICVTSSTACEVSLTLKGSSCFCNASSGIELGLVR